MIERMCKILGIIAMVTAPYTLSAASYEIRLVVGGITVAGDAVRVDVSTTPLPEAFAVQIDAGAVFSVNYHIEFRRVNLFLDDTIRLVRINRIIYRDFWDKQYIIEQAGGVRLYTTPRRDEAIAYLSRIDDVLLAPRRSLIPAARYYFRTRLTAQVVEAYPYFNIFFNFIAALRYKIDWRTSDVMTGRYLVE